MRWKHAYLVTPLVLIVLALGVTCLIKSCKSEEVYYPKNGLAPSFEFEIRLASDTPVQDFKKVIQIKKKLNGTSHSTEWFVDDEKQLITSDIMNTTINKIDREGH
jgi:hypothetical protein